MELEVDSSGDRVGGKCTVYNVGEEFRSGWAILGDGFVRENTKIQHKMLNERLWG